MQSRELQAAAGKLGLQIHVLHASSESDFDAAFATLRQFTAGALVISNDAFFASRTEMLAAVALRHGVPTIFQFREFAAAGGLMTCGRTRVRKLWQVPTVETWARNTAPRKRLPS
jgi:putative ABC transport system substrate-binding protein